MRKITLVLFTLSISVLIASGQDLNNMLNNGLSFLDTPYTANTLEVNNEEELVINCDEVDCVTFVEYALAMSLCPQQGDDMLESNFAKNLQKIRYRDGEISGYTSRLHYVSDWIADNVRMGLIEDITAQKSKETTKISVNYMSSNANQYIHLKDSPKNTAVIAGHEKQLSGKTVHYLPKDQVPAAGKQWINNGDIIALVTNTPGLDVSHMGMAIYIKGNLHLLHASSKEKKVEVERLTLREYLAKDRKVTGIRILRMKDR